MEERLALLQMRNDEIWDLLEDPTIPPLDRQALNEELITNSFEILRIEDEFAYDDDETLSLESFESESIGADEYDREGLIANEDFDLANEI